MESTIKREAKVPSAPKTAASLDLASREAASRLAPREEYASSHT
jgi:hypothetical protein